MRPFALGSTYVPAAAGSSWLNVPQTFFQTERGDFTSFSSSRQFVRVRLRVLENLFSPLNCVLTWTG